MPESLCADLFQSATHVLAPKRIARRHKWRDEVARLELADISAAFKNGGAATPEVVWGPVASDCATSINGFLIAHWFDLAPAGGIPPVTAIDPSFFKVALGYVHLLEPNDAGADFRYRVFGSLISSVSGFDLTGHAMTEFDASDYVVDFAIAASGAVMDRRQPLLTRRAPRGAAQTNMWERLALPFADKEGRIQRLLIGNLPLKADGQVIRPNF